MHHRHASRFSSRARWIAELSAALDEAQMLLSELMVERIDRADADRLGVQIEQLRAELRSLHRRGFAAEAEIAAPRLIHPDWRPRRCK